MEKQPSNSRQELILQAKDMLQESIRGMQTEYFLFESNDAPVGFAIADLEEECFPDEDLPEVCLHVLAFFIKPEYRGEHLGQEALKLLRQWGRDKKAALIEVEADSEGAKLFLQNQGLELVGGTVRQLYRGFI